MKALSLWQPWASLWCSPAKIHETRHWSLTHRGELAVHAAKKFVRDVDPMLKEILDSEFGGHWGMDLPAGALIGIVNVLICKRTDDPYLGQARNNPPDDFYCGDFTPGRFAFERGEFRRFQQPIPYRGRQGLFDVPDALVRAAL